MLRTLTTLFITIYQERKLRQIFITGISSILFIFVLQPCMEFSKPKKEKTEQTEQTENTKAEQKGGGKNSQHANQKAREAAKENWEKANKEFQKLKSKVKKTKEDVALRQKLKKEVEHWKRKMDETGENHSQTGKK